MSERRVKSLFWVNVAFCVTFVFWFGYAKSEQDTSMIEIGNQKTKLESFEAKYYESQIEFHEYMRTFAKDIPTKSDIESLEIRLIEHIDTKIRYIDEKVEWEHELKNKQNDN